MVFRGVTRVSMSAPNCFENERLKAQVFKLLSAFWRSTERLAHRSLVDHSAVSCQNFPFVLPRRRVKTFEV